MSVSSEDLEALVAPHAGSWEEAVRALLAEPALRELATACYFDPPVIEAARRYARSEEFRTLVERYLPTVSGQAVDLGAGNGILSYALARHGWHVQAIEPDPSELVGSGAIRALARAEHLPIVVTEAYGEALPLGDRSADLVVARQVLHHARDLPTLCREIERVLKPGGTFIALRDHVLSRRSDLPRFLEKHPLHRLYGGEHAFTLREYSESLRGAGLEIVAVLRPHHSSLNRGARGMAGSRGTLEAQAARYLGFWSGWLVPSGRVLAAAMWLASWLDRRPGRVFSFVCRKPAA